MSLHVSPSPAAVPTTSIGVVSFQRATGEKRYAITTELTIAGNIADLVFKGTLTPSPLEIEGVEEHASGLYKKFLA